MSKQAFVLIMHKKLAVIVYTDVSVKSYEMIEWSLLL